MNLGQFIAAYAPNAQMAAMINPLIIGVSFLHVLVFLTSQLTQCFSDNDLFLWCLGPLCPNRQLLAILDVLAQPIQLPHGQHVSLWAV